MLFKDNKVIITDDNGSIWIYENQRLFNSDIEKEEPDSNRYYAKSLFDALNILRKGGYIE